MDIKKTVIKFLKSISKKTRMGIGFALFGTAISIIAGILDGLLPTGLSVTFKFTLAITLLFAAGFFLSTKR